MYLTRLEKCQLAIEKGYIYNPETGKIYGMKGREITRRHKDGYIQIKIYLNGKYYGLQGHQFAWYCVHNESVEQLDHVNGIRDDNRISNLRSVSHQQNQHNRTKAKGYHFHKQRNKWQAQIRKDGKAIHLGLFNTEEEARAAYLKAKQIHHII